jgi:hypothetical protein
MRNIIHHTFLSLNFIQHFIVVILGGSSTRDINYLQIIGQVDLGGSYQQITIQDNIKQTKFQNEMNDE